MAEQRTPVARRRISPIRLTTTIGRYAVLGLGALAMAANGWMRIRVSPAERILAAVAAILLFVPRLAANVIGGALLVLLAARQWRRVPDARL